MYSYTLISPTSCVANQNEVTLLDPPIMRKTLKSKHLGSSPALVLLAVAICVSGAFGEGKLDAFESDVTRPKSERSYHLSEYRSCESKSDSCVSDFFGSLLSELAGRALSGGGACSLARITDEDPLMVGLTPRTPGEALIPFVRADISYMDVESDIDALDLRTEGGYGPVGAHLNLTRYSEDDPKDELSLMRALGLYRMSLGSCMEVDLGAGALWLDGERTTTRFLFSIPVLIHPSEHWGLEFRPAWAGGLSDYDIGALLSLQYASLKIGYRWVHSLNESLDGPYVGFSMRL